MKIGCVIMAAGAGSRFGENKLLAPYRGIPLFKYAFAAAPKTNGGVCVVSGCGEILRAARERGFIVVRNSQPELGASLTVRLGVGAMADCGGLMFMVADQPLLKKETAEALLRFFSEKPDSIAALSCEGRRKNPCVFPQRYFSELSSLEGDTGGSAVISAHPESLRLMEAGKWETRDVDSKDALRALP